MDWQRLVIASEQHQGGRVVLTPAQQHYLQRVLRLREGDRFIALDGQGAQWIAVLASEPGNAAIIEAIPPNLATQPEIVLAAALPKGNGFDEVVRQGTELGVSSIQPVISDRTLLKPSPNRLERWRRIATEASEQSEQLVVPDIRSPLPWPQFLKELEISPEKGHRYLCTARGNRPHLIHCLTPPPEQVVIAVGPEGGWTNAEIAAAIAVGFQPVSLGPMVLRAVTAPLAALTLVQAATALGKPAHHPSDQPVSGH
ncbi:16S rRNA (uracil(1498)-N(3))-methyltransferase [filamentous cyanobacterium CCP5]|nr:16S rRNA (uracil(1498)-N(3))-methyltransferase [filamentous cyanobacterium CCP5]